MTQEEKSRVAQLRNEGCGYTAIAKELGISKETIKSFCRRNAMGGQLVQQAAGGCPFCGKPVEQTGHSKMRRFCSTECRQKWWNSHPERVHRKAMYDFVCAECGEPFTAYGNSSRKYCCHECYVKARFKGGAGK